LDESRLVVVFTVATELTKRCSTGVLGFVCENYSRNLVFVGWPYPGPLLRRLTDRYLELGWSISADFQALFGGKASDGSAGD